MIPSSAGTDRAIEVRRVDLEPSFAALPRHFAADGDFVASHVLAVLSSVFPDGEDFFVRSVRRFREDIDDPVLRRQVNAFVGQETVHGREHRALNRRLQTLGYPARTVERVVDRGLRIRERLLSARANLAATAALEHYTATLAAALLTDPELRAMVGDRAVLELFLWHALEELEHKAVAFDVYRAVGGSERMRTVTMRVIDIGFPSFVAAATAISLLSDPAARRQPRRVWRSLRAFARSPLVDDDLIARLREYREPGFHPSNHDTAVLVDTWRDELFGPDGRIRAG